MNFLKAACITVCAALAVSLAVVAFSGEEPSPSPLTQSLPAGEGSSALSSAKAETPAASSKASSASSQSASASSMASSPASSQDTSEPAASASSVEEPQSASVFPDTDSAAAPDAAPQQESEKTAFVSLSSNVIQPGETLLLTLTGAEHPEQVQIQNDFQFAARLTDLGDGRAVSFIPASYFTQPGDYSLTVISDELPGGSQTLPIQVAPKDFEVQQLTVDEDMANDTIFNDDASAEYREKIWPLKEIYDDAKYFDGPFIRPVEGGITTEFGMIRYVNGQPNPRHDGVDIDAGLGTPIRAAQNGRVLFADFVKLTGNTIVIEHGCGLKSWYMHLDTIDVAPDDFVQTGDILGTVGATGFVTGPHLHFSASINGVYIDPFSLEDSSLLDF